MGFSWGNRLAKVEEAQDKGGTPVVRCPRCGRQNVRASKRESLLVVLFELVKLKAMRCRECRRRFFVPWHYVIQIPLPESPAEAMSAGLTALTAGISGDRVSNWDIPPSTTQSQVEVVSPLPIPFDTPDAIEATAAQTAGPSWDRVRILALQSGDLKELDGQTIYPREANGSALYSLVGWTSRTQIHSSRPVFLVPSALADEFELFPLDVSDGRRLLIYSVRHQRVIQPVSVRAEIMWDGLAALRPIDALQPGEYVLTPKSSDRFYSFGIAALAQVELSTHSMYVEQA